MPKYSKSEREEALARLREWIKPGATVYTVLDHVSRSGMSRNVRVVLLEKDDKGEPYALHPNHAVAVVLGLRRAKNGDGVVISGCGMDMGLHLVYELSHALFRGGFGCIGEGCPSNDHSNGDRDYTPHMDDCPQTSEEVGTDIPKKRAHNHYHKDGGYCLRHRWL